MLGPLDVRHQMNLQTTRLYAVTAVWEGVIQIVVTPSPAASSESVLGVLPDRLSE